MNQDPVPMTRQGLVRAPGRVLVQELAGERQDKCQLDQVFYRRSDIAAVQVAFARLGPEVREEIAKLLAIVGSKVAKRSSNNARRASTLGSVFENPAMVTALIWPLLLAMCLPTQFMVQTPHQLS